MCPRMFAAAVFAMTLGVSTTAPAEIVRVQITTVESPTFEGVSFGAIGQYEKLVGRAFGELDPADPRNAGIADIALAPRNARGMVEYVSDIYIFRPIDRSRANGRVLFDLPNRGTMMSLAFMGDTAAVANPVTAAHAGNGFLMRQGYTILAGGWEPGAAAGAGRLTIQVPTATNPDGSPVVGQSLQEFVTDAAMATGALSFPAATLDKSQASLTVRVLYDDAPTALNSWDWEFVNDRTIRLLPAETSFAAGRLYEFTYPAKNPVVAGIGFAAIRDLAAVLRSDVGVDADGVALAGDVRAVYTFCYSLPCRAMNDFVQLGFNEGETGQPVVDGILNWAAGASGIFLNQRFAQPTRTHRQHIGRWYPELQFPFAPQVTTDLVTGRTDGRLRRCLASGTCPKILALNSENEYWSKNMALWHTDTQGRDLPDAPGVRTYLLSSVAHTGAVGPTGKGMCQQTLNPLVANPVLRALLLALDDWVTAGVEPPASRLPRAADGTLVASWPQAGVGFPTIPGVTFNGRIHTGELLDFGPQFEQGIMTVVPPAVLGAPYPARVPATDADGHDIAGVRLPEVAAPLATYTGWGLRAIPAGANEGCDHYGQRIDFFQTMSERLAAGDPRLSIEERYPNHGSYVSAVARAAAALRAHRLLLDEDVERYVTAAAGSSIGRR